MHLSELVVPCVLHFQQDPCDGPLLLMVKDARPPMCIAALAIRLARERRLPKLSWTCFKLGWTPHAGLHRRRVPLRPRFSCKLLGGPFVFSLVRGAETRLRMRLIHVGPGMPLSWPNVVVPFQPVRCSCPGGPEQPTLPQKAALAWPLPQCSPALSLKLGITGMLLLR